MTALVVSDQDGATKAMIRDTSARITIAILTLATVAIAILLLVFGVSFLTALTN